MVFQIKSDSSGRAQHAKRPIVLVVDDHEDNLFLLSCSLEPFDCNVVGKTTGQAALEFVKLNQPALVLLDLMMPDIQGVELMHLLQQQLNPTVPIVAVTGMAASEYRDQMISAGFSDYLGKPYLLEDLEGMVQRWGILPCPAAA